MLFTVSRQVNFHRPEKSTSGIVNICPFKPGLKGQFRAEHLNLHAYLLDNLSESVVVLNQKDEIIYLNQYARQLFLLEKLDLNCVNLDGFFPLLLNILANIKPALKTEQVWTEDQSLIFDDQTRILRHSFRLLSDDPQSNLIIIVSKDITDLTEALNRSEEAQSAKRRFLTNITHELRTPLIGILGSADLLEHELLNGKQLDNVDIIRECSEKLLTLIDDLLEVSNMESGISELNPTSIDLHATLKEATSIIQTFNHGKKLLFELNIDARLPRWVHLDASKFQDLVENLLHNAIKFTPQGEIKVTAKLEESPPDQKWLLFSVSDTGIGIPAHKWASIFEPFTQVDNSSSRNSDGSGLGLFMCKKIVDLMKGEIWVDSQAGDITVFSFRIPLLADLDTLQTFSLSDSVTTLEADLSAGFTPISVLLVEDNELNQKLLAQMLTNFGFEVLVAANGLECLNVLQYKDVDIILMDMQMPMMDGYEASRVIRKNSAWNHIPIIAVTANSMQGDREKCLACGCAAYLAKPFKAEALVQEIKTNLHNKFIKRKNSDPQAQQLIAELLPEFIEMLGDTLQEMASAMDSKNMVDIKNISHGLKGTAGMYGFMQMSELSALMEKAAVNMNYDKISSLYQQISSLAQTLSADPGSMAMT